MSGTWAELVTQALIAHSPAVLVTRVEESWYPAETDGMPLLFVRFVFEKNVIQCKQRHSEMYFITNWSVLNMA